MNKALFTPFYINTVHILLIIHYNKLEYQRSGSLSADEISDMTPHPNKKPQNPPKCPAHKHWVSQPSGELNLL